MDNKFFPKKNLQSGTLSIVLTTQCNYKCKYCFAEGGEDKQTRVIPLEKLKPILKKVDKVIESDCNSVEYLFFGN